MEIDQQYLLEDIASSLEETMHIVNGDPAEDVLESDEPKVIRSKVYRVLSLLREVQTELEN